MTRWLIATRATWKSLPEEQVTVQPAPPLIGNGLDLFTLWSSLTSQMKAAMTVAEHIHLLHSRGMKVDTPPSRTVALQHQLPPDDGLLVSSQDPR